MTTHEPLTHPTTQGLVAPRNDRTHDGVARIADQDYAIGAPLGRGASAHVVAGVELARGTAVAIKIHTPGHMSADAFVAAALVNQQHPHAHLLPVVAHGDIDGAPCIVLPLVHETLATLSANALRANPERLCEIARQLGAALGHLHAHGVVHGNVTPDNIAIRSHTATAIDVALTDLGLGNAGLAHAPFPRSGWSLNGIGFAAPEQHHAPTSDPRTDVYGLAATLWWCLTGNAPLPVAHPSDHPSDHPESADASPMSHAVRAVLTQALAVAPADRFPTVSAFVAALYTATAPTPNPSFGRNVRRMSLLQRLHRCWSNIAPRTRRALIAASVSALAVGIGCIAWNARSEGMRASELAALRASIPATLRATCVPTTWPSKSTAALQCRDAINNVTVTYARFRNRNALDAWFTNTAREFPVGATSGECARGGATQRAWRARADAPTPSGRVLCTPSPRGSTYAWTTDAIRTGTLAIGERSVADMWTWWQRVPGPVPA